MCKSLLLCLLCLFSFSSWAQNQSIIKGEVTTADNEPVENASLRIASSKNEVKSNPNGYYEFKNVEPGELKVILSLNGVDKLSKTISVQGGQQIVLNFVIDLTATQLDAVTVMGNKTNRFSEEKSGFVSKMPLKRMENPQVYNSIDKELLANQVVFTVDDALNNVPGLQKMWAATGRSEDGGSYYSSRGFIMQSSLRNGIAGRVSSVVDAVNIEKIEVLKGPSATLFGNALTSYGGAINRVTKIPFDEFAGTVAMSGGSYDFYRLSADINTPINAAKNLMFRISTAYNNEGNFQNQGYSKNFTLAPSLLFRPNDRLSVQVDAEIFTGENVGNQMFFFYFPTSTLGINSPDDMNVEYGNSYMGNDLTQKARSINLFGKLSYKLSNNFTSTTLVTTGSSYSDGFSPYFYLIPDSTVTHNPADVGKSNYLVRADQSTGNSKNRMYEIQQNFNGEFNVGNMRNRVVLGLDFIHENSNQLFYGGIFDVVPLNQPGFDFDQFNGESVAAHYNNGNTGFNYPIVVKNNTYSAFVSNVLNLSDQLSVLAALRIDHFDNKGGKAGGEVKPFSQTALSPKFGLVYQPIKDKVALFANYQNSFSNLGAYTVADASVPGGLGSAIADLEQANQIEGGVKLDLIDGKLSSTISYYRIKVENVLRANPENPLAKIQNGTQLSKGIELDLIANPINNLDLIAGFSYNDSEYTKADADVEGRRPATAMSPYTANLWVSYRLPSYLVNGLGLGFGGNYASENKVVNSASMGVFTLPAYTVLNASAFYEFKQFRLSAKVNNLSNQKYWIGYTTVNPQSLRSFIASISYKF